MRLSVLLTVGCLVSCGSSIPQRGSLQYWQELRAKNHRIHQTGCTQYQNLEDCAKYGKELLHLDQDPEHPDWQDTYPMDRDAAKQPLLAACKTDKPFLEAREACGILLDQKWVSVEDAFPMCTASAGNGMCGALADKQASSLDAKQWNVLCEQRVFLCDKALPHLSDPAEKAYADMGAKFHEVSITITGYAAHAGASDDDDDDDGGGASTSSDSACHKDTDCKGDRICQSGSCVDPGTKPEKTASLGVAECDEVAQLIETKVFACSNLSDQALRDAYKAFRDAWAKVQPDRLKAMAPVCKEEIDRVNANLEHAHCN